MNPDDFLKLFFSPPNLINYKEVKRGKTSAYSFLRENIAWLEDEENPQFTILPFSYKKGKPSIWCGLAFSSEQKIEMKMYVNSFIGRTYADLNNLDVKEDSELGKTILDFTNGFAIKFTGDSKEIMRAIQRMNNLRKNKPHIDIKKQYSTGNLLRSFYFATEAHDKNEASRLYDIIAKRKFLDATNLLFLDVYLKSKFEEWALIYQHQHYSDLLSVRRPKLVSQSLIQSVYFQKVLPEYHKHSNIDDILKFFKEEIFPHHTYLFQQNFLTDKPEVLILRMMQYLTVNVRDHSLVKRITAKAEELKITDELWQKLLSFHLSQTGLINTDEFSSEEAHQLMIESFNIENFEGAKFYASRAVHSDVKASILLNCAIKLDDPECFNQYLATNKSLSRNQQEIFSEQVEKLISLISSNIWIGDKEKLPENWIELIEKINQDDEFAQKRAPKFVEEYLLEWSSKDFLTIDNFSDRLIKALEASRSDTAEKVLKRILPKLITFLWEEEAPSAELRNVYYTIFTLLVITEDLHRGELLTINELVLNILTLGVTSDDYREILASVNDQYQYYESPNTIECIIDFLDIVLLFPVLDKNTLVTLLSKIKVTLESITKISDVEEQIQLFNSFCDYLQFKDYQLDVSTSNKSTVNPWEYYQNKSIAIYTLTDGAAQRVGAFFKSLALNVNIAINHDHVGTEQLKDLARNADVFLMVTGSAKHAATSFIKQNRGEKELLYPLGKGSSSILSKLKENALNKLNHPTLGFS